MEDDQRQMLFNSYSFIFVFLPLALLVFYGLALKAEFKTAMSVLVIFSLAFYAYWNPAYLPLLLLSIGFNFAFGSTLYKHRNKTLLGTGIALNLALIAYYKYSGFFVASMNDLSGSDYAWQAIILPLGISFFTFQQITYLVDTYKGKAKNYSFLDYCQFVTFFPQLIAGPIVHHHEMMPQFNKQKILANVNENLSVGLTIFFIGLFKKVILADSIAIFASPVFDTASAGITLTLYEAWIGAFAYTLQLYFDFSGYSDMAIGLARMFGITLPVNFNSPYKANNIIDFWRRWHVTLSRFLRDYLYIPLGGSRHGRVRRNMNLFLTMLLGGLWHGAGWTFVIWGAMHGSYLMINHAWRSLFRGDSHSKPSRLYSIFSRVLTLLAVVFAWVVFRADNWDTAKSVLMSMLGLNGIALPHQLEFLQTGAPAVIDVMNISFGHLFFNELFSPIAAIAWIAFLASTALVFPNTQEIMQRYKPVIGDVRTSRLQWKPDKVWAVALSIISTYTLLHLSSISEFLYFQF